MTHLIRLSLLALAVITVSGCGGKPARTIVKGKVTVAGKGPLTGGAIQFVLASDAKVIGGGQIKADGSYEITEAPVGECKVVIDNTYMDTATASKGLPTTGPGFGMGAGGGPKDMSAKTSAPPKGLDVPGGTMSVGTPRYIRIDPSFTKADSTPLKTVVTKSGANPADFDVK